MEEYDIITISELYKIFFQKLKEPLLLYKNFDLLVEITKMNIPFEKTKWILKKMIEGLPLINQR
jgi:hypothetical protein